MKNKLRLLTLAALLHSSTSWATIMEVGTGFTIFDNSTDASTISVADNLLVDSLSITLDISHS